MKFKSPYTCLWFSQNAAEAARYYCEIFDNAAIISENEFVVMLNLSGTRLMMMNGGDKYRLSPAVSLVIECKNQEEIDFLWEYLGKEGRYDRCGWLQDRFGLSWQIIPEILPVLMQDKERAPRVANAFLSMQKFIIRDLLTA